MINEIEFEFKEDCEEVFSDDPWYDLTDGGYIKPEDMLSNPEQLDKLNQAIRIVQDFFEQAVDSGILQID